MKLSDQLPTIGDGTGLDTTEKFFGEELRLALRNRGLPLEAMRHDITPSDLHYLLIHYDIPDVRTDAWRLEIGGLVKQPQRLSLEDIKALPAVTLPVTMECAGNGRALYSPRRLSQPWHYEAIGTSEWTGTPLRAVLENAGLSSDASEIVFTGLDRGVEGEIKQNYQRSLSVSDAMRKEVLLAYEMNGQPLPPQHGYPLRLLVPGWYGMTSVKWLSSIEATHELFSGYQQSEAYRYKEDADDSGEPVDEIRVRSLMIPPGIPDFMTRTRLVATGIVALRGRAWAGRREIAKVEVSVDGGGSWREAELGDTAPPFAWRSWQFEWDAHPGKTTLAVRATDSEGNRQPWDQAWNFGGYGNNSVQRVNVIVE